MNRQAVSSSNIHSIGYENNTLEIEFNNGSIYQYHGVPITRYSSLMSASSYGRYFHTFIEPFYNGIKIH